MPAHKTPLYSKLSTFTMAVSAEVTAARLAVVDGKRTYAGKLLCRVMTRVKDHQQRPSWYPVATELFKLRCAVETIGKRLRVPIDWTSNPLTLRGEPNNEYKTGP